LPRIDTRKARLRQRILDASYDLFAENGVSQVGIGAILHKSGCAKTSLYDQRATSPREWLLAIFDVFDVWFHKRSFEGCSFINVLLESKKGSPVRRAAANHLNKIRAIILDLANEAGLSEPEKFAQAWHMLMKGSIVAAGEGNRNAAREAKEAATLIWATNGKR
jgi:hypothetical protein